MPSGVTLSFCAALNTVSQLCAMLFMAGTPSPTCGANPTTSSMNRALCWM
jgi:hypothetical protein